jgi:hypothetical protein
MSTTKTILIFVCSLVVCTLLFCNPLFVTRHYSQPYPGFTVCSFKVERRRYSFVVVVVYKQKLDSRFLPSVERERTYTFAGT